MSFPKKNWSHTELFSVNFMFAHSSQGLKGNCLYIVNIQLKTLSGESIRMTQRFYMA